jgi:hypothetical protein
MPVQYPYPQNGWSTGKMRKVRAKNNNSEDYRPDFEHAFGAVARPMWSGHVTPEQERYDLEAPQLGPSAYPFISERKIVGALSRPALLAGEIANLYHKWDTEKVSKVRETAKDWIEGKKSFKDLVFHMAEIVKDEAEKEVDTTSLDKSLQGFQQRHGLREREPDISNVEGFR